MKVLPITTYNYKVNNFNKKNKLQNALSLPSTNNNFVYSNISFGWCDPHVSVSKKINSKIKTAISNLLEREAKVKNDIALKNKMKQTKYALLDDAAANATQLFSQYCNMQYTVAEMIPTYALSTNESLVDKIKQMDVFQDPVKILIAINNVTQIKTRAGIDKNTGKEYTKSQTEKARAGTQLYVTTFLLKQLKEQLENVKNPETKEQIENLLEMVSSSLDDIYGKDTVKRILDLSDIGLEPTLEEKRASVKLIEEFDGKAKELNFSEEFKEGLKNLIESENIRLGKTIENTGVGIQSSFEIKLSYHTHAHHAEEHHHHHHHDHGEMSEEEHRRYHELEHEQERLKAKQ